MKKQPIKNSALNFSLIENGAAMIEHDGWNIATNFGNIEDELNAANNSVAISDISSLSKYKLPETKLILSKNIQRDDSLIVYPPAFRFLHQYSQDHLLLKPDAQYGVASSLQKAYCQ